ncbi:MAG: CvpA family protein [Proteobacteria bacterium]|nr:CvpA family protein [Pseudomonadota bacterium]
MTWVDVAILGGLGVSALIGLLRGFVREVLGIAAWVGAGAIAVWAHPVLTAQVRDWLPNDPSLASPIAFAAAFLVSLVVLLIITHLIAKGVHRVGLGSLDRSLGLLFGLARGAALVVLAYILAQMVIPIDQWPPVVQASRAVPFAYQGAVWAVDWLPEAERPRISAPAAAEVPTVETLLRALPRGMALSRRGGAPSQNQESR